MFFELSAKLAYWSADGWLDKDFLKYLEPVSLYTFAEEFYVLGHTVSVPLQLSFSSYFLSA